MINFKQLLVEKENLGFIEEKINLSELDKRRKEEESKKKFEGGEYGFRIADNWYRLNMGYTNPLNHYKVHAELLLMEGLSVLNKEYFTDLIRNKEFIFYGVGIGDTEIVPISWALKNNSQKIYVTGIDINREFLQNFIIFR